MNFKRGRPKNSRAGCLMCKPWKGNKAKEPDTMDVRVADQPEEGPQGNRSPKKATKPQVLKVSCSRCGRLVAKYLCETKKDFRRLALQRFRMICCKECEKRRRPGSFPKIKES